jgi:cytosine/adenosine deaminase-related metal-dependent hydrolase
VTSLLVRDAEVLVTMDGARRELAGGWVLVQDGLVAAVGTGVPPEADRVLSAAGCLVTPGLINTHHHVYQNLARSFAPVTTVEFFTWLEVLTPIWARLDEEAVHEAAWVGLAELALGGCTTSTDHLYLDPFGDGRLIAAEIAAAADLGMRFHPTHGSMDITAANGGFAPPALGGSVDQILSVSESLVGRFHDPSHGSMCRVALAPAATYLATPSLLAGAAALAERLDLRLHTHVAYTPEEDPFCEERYGCSSVGLLERSGWMDSGRAWVAHAFRLDDAGMADFARWDLSVAHCPCSGMLAGGGITPVPELRAAGVPVGLGVDGSASTDCASMWLEARQALLMARYRCGPASFSARDALEVATLGGAACLGRLGELGSLEVGAVGDLVCWPVTGVAFAGAHTDLVEAWLRCGPVSARHTVVAGTPVVEDGALVHPDLESHLAAHAKISRGLQGVVGQ